MNYYPNYNQFYPSYNQPFNRVQQPMPQTIEQFAPQQQIQNKPMGLLGKSVDSIEVAKVMDIQLDGSTSYFPLTDGTAIVTKQLQNDGTSKTIIYRPVQDEETKIEKKYVTTEELTTAISGIDLSDIEDLKDELDELKKQIKELKKNKNKED